jgi:cytochrome b involved in lipid metabolism
MFTDCHHLALFSSLNWKFFILIIRQVYDVTPYVEEHPGGDAILNNAGGDSTEGFFGFVTSHVSYNIFVNTVLKS